MGSFHWLIRNTMDDATHNALNENQEAR